MHMLLHKSTYIHTQACPKSFLHIHKKHRVRTNITRKGRNKTIYGYFWITTEVGGFRESEFW